MNEPNRLNPRQLLNMLVNLPGIIRLVWRLVRDRRTPMRLKLILFGAVLYVVSPADLIPGFLIPVLGQIDDVVVLILATQYFLKSCPPELIAEHKKRIEEERSG
ncbi:MAG: DUF1232 domain-containing protein [candidate division KSB1 bacterium]|nr:DUF1232 domain-containing protein [candidate division KSB1 bacterium]